MATSKGNSASKPVGGGGSGDDGYDKRFQELQKHIPFLKGMMRKLEHSSDKLRAAQLNKMKNLYSLLSNPKKRLKLETLEKCEDVLSKLQEKLKGFSPGSRSCSNVDNGESSQASSSSSSQIQLVVEKPSDSESNNFPFLCDSDSKSTFTSRESSGSGTNILPSKPHDERPKAETGNRLESNLDSRNNELFKSDASVNFHHKTNISESVQPKEVIPCLDSPSSPTQTEAGPTTHPICIPLERKEPLSAFQESRERLKKIMTTQQAPAPIPRRRDSFTQPSFTVQQARAPEVLACAQDNLPSTPVRPFNSFPPPPLPHLGITESRPDVPPPLPSPAYVPDRKGTPAKLDVDPDFPFLKKNESYLPLNPDPEFPYLKKTESFIPPTPNSTPVSNPDVANRSPVMSLRAKLGQEIDVVHKVGVSTGGALRILINKEERKSIEKKDDESEKEKTCNMQPPIDIEKATKDPRKDPRRSSTESQSSGGNTPNRVDPRRSSVTSTDTAADDNLGFPQSRGGFHLRNDIGSLSVDNHNVTPVSCSPSEGGRKLSYQPLISDPPRQTQLSPLTPPIKSASSPLLPDPQSNQVSYDPYPPAKPDFYSRQSNQRAHLVCSTSPFPQNRPSVPRFQTPNRVLLPTPSRVISPWANTAGGSVRQTSAHQLGLRYTHRPLVGLNTTVESRYEHNVAKQGAAHQSGRHYDSKNTIAPGKDTIPPLFTPDRVRSNPPLEVNTPNALHRRETNADVKAGGRRENALDKYRSSDVKKREQDDQEKEKDRGRNWDIKKSHRKAKDNFTSPLGSLYDTVPPPKTGKGYGIQNFKIPKKKTDPPPENKTPIELQASPVPLPPVPVNKSPIYEQRRISPLRDPRTLRGKSRPPSPVRERVRTPTPDISEWVSDTAPSLGSVSDVSSEFPFSQVERLPADNQIKTLPQTFTSKGAPNAFMESDMKLRDDSRNESPSSDSNAFCRNLQEITPAGSRSPYRSKSRGRSPWSGTGRSPERSKSRARSRPRSRTPERSKSRARSRPGSRTPERGRSRACSRPPSRIPERSTSRAWSRPRSRTPERSKSRARSRPRSRTPVRSTSRARSRLKSRTPDRCKSRARSRLRSRSPERSRSRARSRPRSRTPVRSKSSRSPDGRKSRARSRNRSKSRGRSRSASASDRRSSETSFGKGLIVEKTKLSAHIKTRSRSREKSSSGRSTSQESHRTNDSGSYSRSRRRRSRSEDRDATSHLSRSRRRSRSSSRDRSRPVIGHPNSRSGRSQRKRSESPSPRRGSRRSSRSRGRRKSRSRSPSRDIETITMTDSKTEETEDLKLSSTCAAKTESDVSSSSDSKPVGANSVSDAESKEVLPTQSAEKVNVDSSVQVGKDSSKPGPITNEVEDKLAALKDLLGNADLMKYLVEKNIINLSAVGNIPSAQPVTVKNETGETNSSNIVAPTTAPPSDVQTLNATTETSKTSDVSDPPKTSDVSEPSKTSDVLEPSKTSDVSEPPKSSFPEAPKAEAFSETPKIAVVPECQSTPNSSEAVNAAAVSKTPEPVAEEVPKIADISEDSQTSADTMPTASSIEETPPLPQQVKRPTRKSRKKPTTRKTKAARAPAPSPSETPLVDSSKESGEKLPRRRGKNELERLQEDIREMFISAEVVTATGQRTCRVRREAQEHGAKSRNSSSEKSKTESDMDFRSRSRNREEDSSRSLNSSSDSNRSEGTGETGKPAEVFGQNGSNSDDDDTPLNVIQRTLEVRSPAASECSPIRAASKKRKYNVIDSETESEVEAVEEGRVSSCSVVIENIAPLSLPKDVMVPRAPSRNMARRGKRLNFPNVGNRKVPLGELPSSLSKEEPKPTEEEESAESVKSLIDCNNIISWPDGAERGKLTRSQLKMRLTEQDVDLSKASVSKSDDSLLVSDKTTCSEGATFPASLPVSPLNSSAVISSVSSEVIPFSSSSAILNQASPNINGAATSPANNDSIASTSSSIVSAKTSAKNLKTDLKEKIDNALPITLIKTEPGSFDISRPLNQSQELCADPAVNEFVYSNNFVKCRLCPWRGKAVIAHYKCTHPDADVDYARFPVDMASKLYADSEREGYTSMTTEDLAAKFPISKQRARSLLRCLLCGFTSSPLRFSKHFSLHTGEYHYRCASCNFTAPSKEPISEHFSASHEGKRANIEQVVHGNLRPLNIALAHACSLCNFFQLQRQSVESHITKVHPNARDCVPLCVAVSELVDLAAAKSTVVATPTEDTSYAASTKGTAKETESLDDMPVLTREDGDFSTREKLSSGPSHAQVESIETTAAPSSVPNSTSAQDQDLPTASSSSSLSVNTNKAIDLSVFISSGTLESQEQQIEEERLKKLKDAEEALRNRPIKPRMSILDRIAERINAPQDIAAGPSDTLPLPSLRVTAARRANKSLQSMTQVPDVECPEQKAVRQQTAKSQDLVDDNLELAPVSNGALSAGELNSTVELMRKKIETPMLARNKAAATVHQFRNASVLNEAITVSTVFRMQDPNLVAVRVGDVEVRQGLMSDLEEDLGAEEGRKPKDLLYVCHGDTCIFTSSLPKLYVEHLATDHHRWRIPQHCSVCKHNLEEPGDMVYAFNHIITHHLFQEYPAQRPSPQKPVSLSLKLPLVRARRIPGDKLSGPSKRSDSESTSQPEAPSADEDGAPFCIIENVVSLSSLPAKAEDEHVDVESATENEEFTLVASAMEHRPVPPAAPLSPQALSAPSVSTLEKAPDSRNRLPDESTPLSLPQVIPLPGSTPRSTAGRVSFQKTAAVATAMLSRSKLRHFYKCTGRRCSFTTNLKMNFVYHYNVHVAKESERANPETQFEWNKCVYCGVVESSGGRLTEHMLQFHGECCYQCAYCIYRAAFQSNVVFHQEISHPEYEKMVLECRRVAESPPVPSPIQKIKFFKCSQDPDKCKQEFFFKEDFTFHLRTQHSDDSFNCSLCPSEFNSPELLILHCNLTHFMRTYHCLYCRKAAETKKEMTHHMCYDHPEESISVAARIRLEGHSQSSFIEIGEPPDVQKVQIVRLDDDSCNSLDYLNTLPPMTGVLQAEPSEETDDPMQEVQFDNDLPKLRSPTSLNKEVIVLSDEDPPTDSEQDLDRLRVALLSPSAPSKVGGVTTASEPPPLAPLTPLVQIESQASTSEPVRNEDRALSADELVAKTMKEIENTGLVGRALYRCGHTDCSFTAEDMAQLKDHIFVCDFSRLSPALICVHCERVSKTVESFVEHLRSHGLHRYSCSLCDVREPTYHLMTNHIKKKHYFTEFRLVPLHPLQKDPDKALFTVEAKDVAVGKRRTKKVNKPVYYSGKSSSSFNDAFGSEKLAFGPQEVHLLPRSAVFPKGLRCALCNYSNKVRCNLVRHLQHHAEGRVASPTAVVNPVPHLERNNGEKMFDTMTNHAVSSNLAQRRDSTTSAKELEELPIFVAEQARYACSVCSSVTSEDTLHLHLTALHPELKETGYQCPHCRDRPIGAIPLDRIAHHLKMHDSTLYKCPYCSFHHYHRHHVHRHTQDKHPDQQLYIKVVREPESKCSSQNASEMSEQSGPESADSEPAKEHQIVVFQCGICGWEGPRAKVLNHARLVHKTYSSLKCASCEFESNHRRVFFPHFRKTHDGVQQQIISLLKKVVRSEMVGATSNQEKRSKEQPTPSWQLQKGHVKHVRGIMFEENGPKPREMEHGDFGEASGTKRPISSDFKDGPEPKRMFSTLQSSKSASCTKDEPFDKYRCPKCSNIFEMTESQFRIHLLEEAESSTWLCHICSKGSENFFCLVKHYATEHHIYDDVFVMKNALYDTRVTNFINGVVAKQQKAKLKESQAGLISQDAGTSRVTRTSRSLASSPVAWTAGQASDSSSDGTKKARLQSSTPIKIFPSPSVASPPRFSSSPTSTLIPGTLKKITVVKPMTHSGKSADESDHVNPLDESGDLDVDIEAVEEDSQSNEEWERFEKPAEQQCSVCKENFTSEELLRSHVASLHGESSGSDRLFSCSHCDFTCKSKSVKRNHERRHWLLRPYKCGYCPSQFFREFDARKHCLRVHPDKPIEVKENNVNSSEQTILPLVRKRKRKSDPGASPAEKSKPSSRASSPSAKNSENPALKIVTEEDYKHVFYPRVYKCSYCFRRNTSLRQLEIHWESSHHNENPACTFKYDEMDFSELTGCKRPYRFRCGMCLRTGSLPVLAEHYKENHGDVPIALRGCPERVFQCGLCVCHFKSAPCLNRHYDRKHPSEIIKLGKITIDPDAEKRQYQCLWCEETSGTKAQREISDSLQALAEHHHKFHCHLDPKYKEINNILLNYNKPSEAAESVSACDKLSLSKPANLDAPGSSTAGGPVREESSDRKVRSVAKKSTSKMRSVARKSTSKPSRACVKNVNYMDSYASSEDSDNDSHDDSHVEEREGTSFYGRPSSPIDVKRVTCPIQCGPVVRRVNVATAAQEMDLHPVVVCVDISDSPKNSQQLV